MKSRLVLLSLAALLLSFIPPMQPRTVPGQTAQKLTAISQQLSPEEIIRRFTQKESELREAWRDYTYRQETKLQVLGPANTISGEFYQVSEFVFDDAGRRNERIIKAPPPTLDQAGLRMSSEDRNGFVNLQPFALTKEEAPKYNIRYLGREKLDELNTWLFEVTPKMLTDARELERAKKQKIEGVYFQGRVWVDDEDFQIVKTAGKLVPEFEQRFPKFETYRENLDGKYWFPTYTYGDDELEFKDSSVHVRMVVRYKGYRQFKSDVKILDDPALLEEDEKNNQAGKPATKEPEKKDAGKKEPEKKKPPQP